MASDRKLNIYSDNQLTIIDESPTVEVITIYEQGPQGPRGEKGEDADLPTEIISGSGANNLLALYVSGGYITGSKNLSFDGSNLSISGSIYISTFSGSAVSLAGISQDNNLTNITIGSGLNLLDNTLNAVGSLTGTGSITQLAFWTASKAISGSQNLVYDYTNGRLGINNSNPQYELDVSGTVHLSGSLINVSHIDFSTSSYSTNAPARITWNPDFGTLDLGVGDGNVNLSWGLEVAAYVVNGEVDTLVDGEVVYMSGSRGDKPKVYRASSVTELTSTKTFGVVTEPISSNQLGYVTTQGVVNGLNLSSFNSGDAVWLGTTPGTFTATKPQAPTHSVFVGIVQRANAGDGQLYVRVQNGYEIDELHNVRITNPLNGQLLTYNQAQQIWVNGNTLSGSYFVSGSIQATSFTGSLLGTASYADIIRSGGVLGSGGANQVAFWSDTGSLTGNSLMLVESANNRFRIGNIYYGTSGITTTQGGSAASIFMSSANRNINMDGNVGIGTSPVAVLHVSGSSGSGLFEIDSNSSQNILFVSGSGNIGIGTNTPAFKLDVTAPSRIHSMYIGQGLGIGNVYMGESVGGQAGSLMDQNVFIGALAGRSFAGNANGNTAVGYNALQGGNNAEYNTAVGYFALVNNSAGQYNVAVGAFAGNDATSGPNTFIGYNTGRGITTGTGNTIIGSNVTGLSSTLSNTVIIADSSGNRRINVDSNGNTSLGVVSASARLHVNSSGTTSATYGLQVHNATGTNNGLVVRDDSRVGINTTSLTAELTVNGGVSATVLTASNTGGIFFPNSLFRIYKPGSYLGHEYSMDWSMRDGHVFTKNSAMSIGMTSGNIRNLSSQGGINLDSAGNANYYPLFISYAIANTSNQTGNATGIYLRANESSLRGMSHNLIDLGNASGSIFNITNRGVAYISSSLGIGTNAPAALLHISGSSSSKLFELDSDSVQNIIYISGSGNVGIRTNNPAYTLDVSGTGRFTSGLNITGSVIVSGSSTFTNIGPAIFSGSVGVAGSITATQFIGDGSQLTGVATPTPIRRHDYSGSYSYCGIAPSGSSEASSVWSIDRIEVLNDGNVTITSASLVTWTGRYTHIYV